MNDTGAVPSLPVWLARRIRRAAVSAALSNWLVVLLLIPVVAGIVFMLLFDKPESMAAGMISLALMGGLLAFFLWDAWKLLAFFFRPDLSPETAQLRRSGPLADVVAGIERELAEPGALKLGDDAAVTRSWLVLSRGPSFAARRLDDVLWVYPKAQTTKLNGLIPLWTTHSAEIKSDGAPDAAIVLGQKAVATLLERVAAARPGIFVGYDPDVANLWSGEPAQLAAIVKARKSKAA